MDKKQDIKITEKRLGELILIGQKVRDYAATQFEDNHLKVNEALVVVDAVVVTFLLEFSEQCNNITLDEMKYRFMQLLDMYLEEGTKDEK